MRSIYTFPSVAYPTAFYPSGPSRIISEDHSLGDRPLWSALRATAPGCGQREGSVDESYDSEAIIEDDMSPSTPERRNCRRAHPTHGAAPPD
jgi:hypothetical protein